MFGIFRTDDASNVHLQRQIPTAFAEVSADLLAAPLNIKIVDVIAPS